MPKTTKKDPGLQVIMTVSGGVADVLFKPEGVTVVLFDYDVEGVDADDPSISKDPDGHLCCIRQWESSDEVVGSEHWPAVMKAQVGDYSRTWKCPDCGRTIEHSYEALAEVGTPICANCSTDMEML